MRFLVFIAIVIWNIHSPTLSYAATRSDDIFAVPEGRMNSTTYDYKVKKTIYNSKTRVMFVAGLEGTGHHGLSEMFRACNKLPSSICTPNSKIAYNMEQCPEGILVEHQQTAEVDCKGLFSGNDAPSAYKYITGIVNELKRIKSTDTTVRLHVVGLQLGQEYSKYAMLSYPNFNFDSKALSHPDVFVMAKLAESAGIDFRIIVMLRGSEAILVSTISRGFGFNQEPMVLVDNAAVLYSQLKLIDRRFFFCLEYEKIPTLTKKEKDELRMFLHPKLEIDTMLKLFEVSSNTKRLDEEMGNSAPYHIHQLEARQFLIRKLCRSKY
mmetsp:Transcript_21987/g.31583  ORF Transcript_21987/g.31583 Transcript_21987/m.31583 type:complete len:323 (-) Transcript_21987:225-1193(-)|eukprot:CAMPEP_0170083982 /NCGR_PEP_ID=MMETSP0019_2-20121128/19304_1 /TAXON_ID=98059 /ORGANISM="Dinobryon sp., Strain UTEXLB2267" /LENGTH=322 /DNA_ID=CAMNT_0010299865 /DNA_START=56 /DNA_END=1024 /DNA_ORIENTATION=-